MITCCYLEHVIPEAEWGPDHWNLRHWIEGDDPERKMTLLKIGNNVGGLEEGRMRDIVEALASDPDQRISQVAEGVLNGRIEEGALWEADERQGNEPDEEDEEDEE
jgi:hypothetical protein